MEPISFDFDYDSQLQAIYGLLHRQEEADDKLDLDIKNTEEFALRSSGDANEYAVDQWVGLMHDWNYQEAAHSMAAVGMLAPVIESMFRNASGKVRVEWPRNDVIKGIAATVEQLGLELHLPDDYTSALEALFEYRNKMFHFGFEWPEDERQKFDKRLGNWPTNWFKKATIGDEPWMFYMSPEFVRHCLYIIQGCLQ